MKRKWVKVACAIAAAIVGLLATQGFWRYAPVGTGDRLFLYDRLTGQYHENPAGNRNPYR